MWRLTAGSRFPRVVLEVGRPAPWADLELCGKVVETAQAVRMSFVPQILKEPKRAPAGAIDTAVHALDVILVTVSQRVNEGIRSSADRAHTGANGEVVFRQCPACDTQLNDVSQL